jgi:hypothetical protein
VLEGRDAEGHRSNFSISIVPSRNQRRRSTAHGYGIRRAGIAPAAFAAAIGVLFILVVYVPGYFGTDGQSNEYWLVATTTAVILIASCCILSLVFPRLGWVLVAVTLLLLVSGMFGWAVFDEWLETQPGGRGYFP